MGIGLILALLTPNKHKMTRFSILLFFLISLACYPQAYQPLITGAEQTETYLSKLVDKKIAMVVNHTSLVGGTHLVDLLLERKVNIKKIFAPEHGFRGAAADGELIKDGVDPKTKLPLISLYGSNRKPTSEQLADVDIVIFDIQDVGTRFYTYISTMHYVMEACAQQGKKVLMLDRPNPNGSYVDGPVLDVSNTALRSFVGMHPIPTVHGLTVGELALMINGEKWLENGIQCDVEIVTMKNWTHQDVYHLTMRPSPNLPNDQAVRLYPSLCLFEGTVISLGRGTDFPFQVLGNPSLSQLSFQFTPKDIPGVTQNPPHKNQLCYGVDLRSVPVDSKISLKYLIDMYKIYPDKEKFFIPYFDKLAGNTVLKQQIKDGLNEEAIRESWQKDLTAYKEKRKKYLLYP
jgi:uncharacterized protein YbbC (DUF1343 family)